MRENLQSISHIYLSPCKTKYNKAKTKYTRQRAARDANSSSSWLPIWQFYNNQTWHLENRNRHKLQKDTSFDCKCLSAVHIEFTVFDCVLASYVDCIILTTGSCDAVSTFPSSLLWSALAEILVNVLWLWTAECHLVEADDFIDVNSAVFHKPFVEKPVNAEDHNVYIYFPMSAGGGSQRLFRKVRPASSCWLFDCVEKMAKPFWLI